MQGPGDPGEPAPEAKAGPRSEETRRPEVTGQASSSAGLWSAQACVDEINRYRASIGLPALFRWAGGENCADQQAWSDAWYGRAHATFGGCGEYAQNECPGWPGPELNALFPCLGAMWAEGWGGGHFQNMANSSYTEVACGFVTLSDGTVWAIQNFR